MWDGMLMFYYLNSYAQYSGTSGNLISLADQQKLLQYHNIARAQVGSAPLVWDTSLEQAAVKCLQEKKPKEMQHGICGYIPALADVGENLASGGDGPGAALMFIGEKCQSSTQTLQSFTTSYKFEVGHWSQVVWKDSQKMSCAQVQANGVIYCHYSPAGNVIGAPAYSQPPTNSDCNGGTLNEQAFTQSSTPVTPSKSSNVIVPSTQNNVPSTSPISNIGVTVPAQTTQPSTIGTGRRRTKDNYPSTTIGSQGPTPDENIQTTNATPLQSNAMNIPVGDISNFIQSHPDVVSQYVNEYLGKNQ